MATRYRYGKPLGQLSERRRKQEYMKWSRPPDINDLKGILGGVTPSFNPAPGSRQPQLRSAPQEFVKVGLERRKELVGTRDAAFDYSTVLNHFVLTRFAGMGAGQIRMWDRYKSETEGYIVRSSFIHTILYNATAATMVVVMRGGNAYFYTKTYQDFMAFIRSVSKGVHYNASVKLKTSSHRANIYKEVYEGRWS